MMAPGLEREAGKIAETGDTVAAWEAPPTGVPKQANEPLSLREQPANHVLAGPWRSQSDLCGVFSRWPPRVTDYGAQRG